MTTTPQRTRRTAHRPLLAILVALASALGLGLGACSSDQDSGSEASYDATGDAPPEIGDDVPDGRVAAADPSGEEATGTEVATSTASFGTDSRSVILDGSLAIEVEGMDEALADAQEIVQRAGGFVAEESVDNTQGIDTSGRAVYRVPPQAFDAVMDELAGLGEVTTRDVGSQDVTTEVADLDSRLATLDTSIERLRSFLATATDTAAIVELEGELTAREAEAASLEAQRTALADQIEYATATVSFGSESVSPPVVDDPDVGFSTGLETGVDAATEVVRNVLAAFGFVVPFLPVVAALGAVLAWQRHRRRGRHTPAEAAG
jgi:hypothetical protein